MSTTSASLAGIAARSALTSAGEANSRSGLCSVPAPLTWTGEVAISSSSTALFMSVRSVQYAETTTESPLAARCTAACQSATNDRLILSNG